MSDFLQPNMDRAAAVRPLINAGAGLDIITGKFKIGRRNEAILMGGIPTTLGIVGMPNAFKSAFVRYCALIILDHFSMASGHTYDTESTDSEDRYLALSRFFDQLSLQDIIELNRWMVTNSSVLPGEQWFDRLKEFMQGKIANKAKLMITTPFFDRDKTTPFKMVRPNVVIKDSMSEFSTTASQKMSDENSLGESGANTLFMKDNLHKTRFMQEIPALAAASNTSVLITAHLAKEIQMDPRQPPAKTLQYLKQGMKIRKCPPNFEYLTHISWVANAAPPLMTKDKTPEYPRDSGDNDEGDTDLVCVTMTVLRNKTGPSGHQIQLIYSQEEGLLPSLTEFHYVKTHERFGISGNDRNYALDLRPDVNLSRTTVRGKLTRDPLLKRAMNITSELCQIKHHWSDLDDMLCTPKQLFDDLKMLGYDWDLLLDTRGWWCAEEDEPNLKPFLSTVDLLRMRLPETHAMHYHPYWYPKKRSELVNTAKA